jgi:hypothetical protein
MRHLWIVLGALAASPADVCASVRVVLVVHHVPVSRDPWFQETTPDRPAISEN